MLIIAAENVHHHSCLTSGPKNRERAMGRDEKRDMEKEIDSRREEGMEGVRVHTPNLRLCLGQGSKRP